jgi:hypothetical protein
MAEPVAGLAYYAITLLSADAESVQTDVITHWVGFEVVDGRRHEVREASVVDPAVVLRAYAAMGRVALVVSNEPHLTVFLALGGSALVEAELAREVFPDSLSPSVAVQDGLIGFKALALVTDPQALRRAPAPKRRMANLNRDHRQCKICGRCPDDHADLQLRVHHVRPWAEGGLTEDANLMTLCHTCHDGLDPHFDPSLFRYTGARLAANADDDYETGVSRYRELVATVIETERWTPDGD